MAMPVRVGRLSRRMQQFEAERPAKDKVPPEITAWMGTLDLAGLRRLRELQHRALQGEEVMAEFKAFVAEHPPAGGIPLQET